MFYVLNSNADHNWKADMCQSEIPNTENMLFQAI